MLVHNVNGYSDDESTDMPTYKMASLSGIFAGDRAPPAMPHATSNAGMPTMNSAAVPNRADTINTAKPASVVIRERRAFRRYGSGMVTNRGETCRNGKSRLYAKRNALTTKLRTAATPEHMNGTPNAPANTIPQSFCPGRACCQCIATTVAENNATDAPLNTRPRIAAFLAVHSLTET